MNIFQDLYTFFVYQPQLNLLQFIFNFTQDTGVAIIILSIVVNLLMLPLYISSYINAQKVRLLQPQMKDMREKYKDDQQKYLQEMVAFNKKHGVSNGSTFLTLLVQIFFISGLYVLVQDVVKDKNVDKYLYPFIKDLNVNFTTEAFDFLPINDKASDYIWLPILAAVFSFMYGLYVSKLAPKIQLRERPEPKKAKNEKTVEPLFDPEAFQKSLEFNTTFLFPVILFTFNYNLSVGLNLYLVTSTLMSLIRHIFITQYFQSHLEGLKILIEKSDPVFQDGDPKNDYEILDVEPVSEKKTTKKALKKTAKAKKVVKKKVGKK